jgi:hypothetical protein
VTGIHASRVAALREHYGLARRVLELFAENAVPVHVLTKSTLVLRDVDLLERIARTAGALVSFSISSSDDALSSIFEPRAAPPSERLRAISVLRSRGINAGAFLVPTLVTYEMISRMGKDLGIPDNNIRKINEARENGLEALAVAHRANVKIASGSDLLGPMQVYKGMELELKSRVLGPMGAIVATTKTNAELLRKEKDLGTIEAGKLADFILINGDPLKDMTLSGPAYVEWLEGAERFHFVLMRESRLIAR